MSASFSRSLKSERGNIVFYCQDLNDFLASFSNLVIRISYSSISGIEKEKETSSLVSLL